MQSSSTPIVLIRMDRMGDLVLTLPVDIHFENSIWWISQGLEPVVECSAPQRRFLSWKKAFQWRQIWHMWRELHRLRPWATVIFHAPWWVSLVCWLARVPVRVGRKSQWHSFLFLNQGVRQKRSLGERHETDYNLELLAPLNEKVKTLETTPPLTLRAHPGVLERFSLPSREFYVVHPGMGGSAQNWPSKHYLQLIDEIIKETEQKVVVTGTPGDQKYLQPIKEHWRDHEEAKSILFLDGQIDIKELVELLSHSLGVIAPSTGVLHLAASTGVPTIGLFSQVPAENATRWGARGTNVKLLSTPTSDMKDLTVSAVLEALLKFSENKTGPQ